MPWNKKVLHRSSLFITARQRSIGSEPNHDPALDIPLPQPTILIGKCDRTMEENIEPDLNALADVLMLWDQRDRATAREMSRENITGHND